MIHNTSSRLLVNEDNLRSKKMEKTGKYNRTHTHTSSQRRLLRESQQLKVFIEHTEREEILKKMFLVGRSRSNFYTFGRKMQNFPVTFSGKIVKSD